jgi:alpha-D-ribose 1-methylphosphonate 5-triphosphate synthase subunit PhnH
MNANLDLPGFADPVADAQATFRAVLDAMARPGTLHRAGEQLAAPAPLDQATAAVLLTLVDNETPLWLDPAASPARDWLAFHCGAALVHASDMARFAVALSFPDLTRFPAGSHETPEDSAMLILQVPALGHGTGYRLAGPGLREPVLLSVGGLPPRFIAQWQQNHALFPRGVDIILCAGTRFAALPRSVAIEEG